MNFLSLILGGQPKLVDGRFNYTGPSQYAESFTSHYQEKIRPLVNEFEHDRLAALKSFRIRARWFVLISAVIIACAVYLVSQKLEGDARLYALFISFALCSSVYHWARSPVRHYKSNIKSIIFPKVLEFFGDDFRFSERSHWSVHSLQASGILPVYDKHSTEDLVTGTYLDVPLKLMEAELIRVSRDSKGRRYETTLFDGIFILLAMNKTFKSKTVVKRDKGVIGNWFGKRFGKLEHVALEDPVFEKAFEVYSNDQIEARYILSTSFMERLLALTRVFSGSKLQCAFYENNVLMMIASKHNRFEPGPIYEPATFEYEINMLFKEMDEIFSIIRTLKLNEKTGL